MKLIHVKRTTRIENRYTRKMGNLKTNVTRIKKYFINIPVKTIHSYRQTYYGEVKNCEECSLKA
jgi:hypothetical protein